MVLSNSSLLTDVMMSAYGTTFSANGLSYTDYVDFLPWEQDTAFSVGNSPFYVMDGIPPSLADVGTTPGTSPLANFGYLVGRFAGASPTEMSTGNRLGQLFTSFKFACSVFKFTPVQIAMDQEFSPGPTSGVVWMNLWSKAKIHVVDLGDHPDLWPAIHLSTTDTDLAKLFTLKQVKSKTYPLNKAWSHKYTPRVNMIKMYQDAQPNMTSNTVVPGTVAYRKQQVGKRGHWQPIYNTVLDTTSTGTIEQWGAPVHQFFGLMFWLEVPVTGEFGLSTNTSWRHMVPEGQDMTFGTFEITNYIQVKGKQPLFQYVESDVPATTATAMDEAEFECVTPEVDAEVPPPMAPSGRVGVANPLDRSSVLSTVDLRADLRLAQLAGLAPRPQLLRQPKITQATKPV